MASSGTVTINAKSVDYIGTYASGTCYTSANASGFGRGAVTADITLNWTVNDSGLLTVSFGSWSESAWWCICANSYHAAVEFSTDNANWSTIMSSSTTAYQTCDNPCQQGSTMRVHNVAQTLVSGFTPVTLTQSGYIRVRMWAPSACPTTGLPNAFPSDAASATTAVPVHIDVSWTAQLKYAGEGTGMPATQSHTQTGDSYTFTVSNTIPTRTNYRFEGWANVGGGAVAYHGGDSVTVQKSSPTKYLYAVWTEFYRPGAIFVSDNPYQWGDQNGEWYTHNRGSKAAHIMATNGGSTWTEMRTIDAPTGLGDPPAIYHDEKWYNQKKIGKS